MNTSFALAISIVLMPIGAWAVESGEVCALRPDLCDARPVKRARQPASTPPKPAASNRLDFDTYMHTNAAHPAMVHHGPSQKAFQETPKPVTFSYSNTEGPAKDPEGVAPTVPPAPGGVVAAPPATSPPSSSSGMGLGH